MRPVPRLPAVSGRILIVGDDGRQRAALAAMLSGSNFEMQFAADGLEALERLAAFNADVIVADLVMPRMDGFELLRRLKERGDVTPAIALTGFGSMEKALSAIHDLKAFRNAGDQPANAAEPDRSGARRGRAGGVLTQHCRPGVCRHQPHPGLSLAWAETQNHRN